MPSRFAFQNERHTRRVSQPVSHEEPSLFEPRQQHSNAATRKRDRRRVLAWFAEHTGTAHDCAKALESLPTSILPRVTELRKAGCLVPVPGVPRRATGFGGTAAVLIVTSAGLKELRGAV